MKIIIGVLIFSIVLLVELLILLILPRSLYPDNYTLLFLLMFVMAILLSIFISRKIKNQKTSYRHWKALLVIFLILMIWNGAYITLFLIGEKENILESAIKKSREIELQNKGR